MKDRDRIIADVRRGLKRVIAASAKLAASTGDPNLCWGEEDIQHCRQRIGSYRDQLRSLDKASSTKARAKTRQVQVRITAGYPAALSAAIRVFARTEPAVSASHVISFAKQLKLDQVYGEAVVVRPHPPKISTWRPIGLSGLKRRGQQLICRDVLLIRQGDSPCDSTVRGAGGERSVFRKIEQLIEEGYTEFVSVDVKSFFPSLRPGHLSGFPLPQWEIRNLIFLPTMASIMFVDHDHNVALTEQVIVDGDEDDLVGPNLYTMDYVRSMLKRVRQGLVQGDVSSPQIARTFLGRELQRTLGKWDVRWFSHSDDILICARTRRRLKTSLSALIKRLGNHPAGPLELHAHELRTIDGGVEYLGYKFSRRKDGRLYVRPALKRFIKFRDRLFDLWRETDGQPDKNSFRTAGLAYARRWYDSHPAWTKAEADNPDKGGPSWDTVVATVDECLNYYIYREYLDGFVEVEPQIDFEAAEEFSLKTNGVHDW